MTQGFCNWKDVIEKEFIYWESRFSSSNNNERLGYVDAILKDEQLCRRVHMANIFGIYSIIIVHLDNDYNILKTTPISWRDQSKFACFSSV